MKSYVEAFVWSAFFTLLLATVFIPDEKIDPNPALAAQCLKFQDENNKLRELAALQGIIIAEQEKVLDKLREMLAAERVKRGRYSNILDRL